MKEILFFMMVALMSSNSVDANNDPKFDLDHPDARCGGLLYFDFGSANEGTAYYYDAATQKVIGRCGGAKLASIGVKKRNPTLGNCPPKDWTCPLPNVASISESRQKQ